MQEFDWKIRKRRGTRRAKETQLNESKSRASNISIKQAAGSGSESSTKIRDKKSSQESDNFEKFLKTGILN